METRFNLHSGDFKLDTLEYDVKQCGNDAKLSQEDWAYEFETGEFINQYAKKCFDEIMRSKYSWLKDWSFAGRSNGWFVLLIDCDQNSIRKTTLGRIETIVEKYLKNYDRKISTYYMK